jgi:hypothetical protein
VCPPGFEPEWLWQKIVAVWAVAAAARVLLLRGVAFVLDLARSEEVHGSTVSSACETRQEFPTRESMVGRRIEGQRDEDDGSRLEVSEAWKRQVEVEISMETANGPRFLLYKLVLEGKVEKLEHEH